MTKPTTITLTSHGPVDLSGYNVSAYAKDILFKVTYTTGQKYEVVIIKGSEFSDEERTTKNIRALMLEKGYQTPPAEVAVLLREALTDKQMEEMGLWWIVTMHEPIIDSDDDPLLLVADRDVGGRWLHSYYGRPDDEWHDNGGFAAVVSVSAETPEPKTSDTLPCPHCGGLVKLSK